MEASNARRRPDPQAPKLHRILSIVACLATLGIPVLLLGPSAPLEAQGVSIERIEQSRVPVDVALESCALDCQTQIDKRLAQCPGYRTIANPLDSLPAAPRCKSSAIEQYHSCLDRCGVVRVPGVEPQP